MFTGLRGLADLLSNDSRLMSCVAEKLFMEMSMVSCALLFCASLPECYVLPQLAGVLHIAGQLEAHTEHRIRQTAAMVFPVMMRGGLMSPGGTGVAQVLKVRLIHATIRHLILRGNPAQVRGLVPRRQMGEPGGMHQAMSDNGWDVDAQGVPCNQIELAYTLLTFGYSFLQGLRTLGLLLSPADEQAYVAGFWRNATPGEPFEFEHRLLSSDGRKLQVLLALVLLSAGAKTLA